MGLFEDWFKPKGPIGVMHTKRRKKQGIALILTLGIIFILGIIVASFTFVTSTYKKSAKQYQQFVMAINLANSGYNYMVGAIQDYFDRVIRALVDERFSEEKAFAYKGWEKDKDKKDKKNEDIEKLEEKIREYEDDLEDVEDDWDDGDGDEFDDFEEYMEEWDKANDKLQKEIDKLALFKFLFGDTDEIPDPPQLEKTEKITSDEFNQLQSALTRFLNGEPITFAQFSFISEGVAEELDYIMFDETNPNSWAKDYGFMHGRDLADLQNYQYEVDLDGINNYKYKGSLQWDFARSLLKIDGAIKPSIGSINQSKSKFKIAIFAGKYT